MVLVVSTHVPLLQKMSCTVSTSHRETGSRTLGIHLVDHARSRCGEQVIRSWRLSDEVMKIKGRTRSGVMFELWAGLYILYQLEPKMMET